MAPPMNRCLRLFCRELRSWQPCKFPGVFAIYTDHTKQIDNCFVDLFRHDFIVAHSQAEPDDGVGSLSPSKFRFLYAKPPCSSGGTNIFEGVRTDNPVHHVSEHPRAAKQPTPTLIGGCCLHQAAQAECVELCRVFKVSRRDEHALS